MPAPKSTTLDDVAKRPREYPRPAKVDPVATEQEPRHDGRGFFRWWNFSPSPTSSQPPIQRASGVALVASRAVGRTGAAEDRAVPGTMMARPGVDGQAGTGRPPGVSAGRNPYNRAIATG